MRRGFLVAIVVFAGLLCGCETTTNENAVTANVNANANATTNTNALAQSTPARGVAAKHDDNVWAANVAMDGMAEVELAKLAVQKAKNPDVKRFAQRMVTDHSKANMELKQLTSNLGIKIPAALTDAQKAEHDRLAKLSGAEFDREYMSLMTAGHDKAVAAFQEQADNGSVPELKQWATKTLPTLKEHQALAKDIAAKLG